MPENSNLGAGEETLLFRTAVSDCCFGLLMNSAGSDCGFGQLLRTADYNSADSDCGFGLLRRMPCAGTTSERRSTPCTSSPTTCAGDPESQFRPWTLTHDVAFSPALFAAAAQSNAVATDAKTHLFAHTDAKPPLLADSKCKAPYFGGHRSCEVAADVGENQARP
eukprot:1337866-Rhodomonas_salina.2